MVKIYTLIVLVLASFFNTHLVEKNDYGVLILGKWTGTRKVDFRGNDKLRDGRPNKNLYVFEFFKNGKMLDRTFDSDVSELPYWIEADRLTVGKGGKWKIKTLTKKELVLVDFDPKDPTNPLVFTHYFVRTP